ncbi:transcription antitermination factor NusB [Fuerstiella marisgermanici]|uniref:Transcription antitermination protein NusB n=1 Tax=Fuerstiella marisgermanici TaxID=1891926 RepID=A0A1P8WAE2_9PLAN|nr:transcription antitermination factor NusB [Fuerstiella marisgermanici]APZ91028.1 hypothetical protein Fuma_00612 [Fuerstiella marisgermanici]
MPRRSDARRQALQMLYLVDQNPDADTHWIRTSLQEELKTEQLVDLAWSLFTGVREYCSQIDQQIVDVAANWRIERMAPTDRNVIRLGVFEIQYFGTPAAVVLNECIELAREYGTENSPSFVNGVLDKLTASESSSLTTKDESGTV